jgi:hypothetical protein
MKEEAILLGPHRSLVGVYTPAARRAAPQGAGLAAVLLNAGLIHHVGPSRLYVRMARALAANGIAALRVDFSGIGDSSPRPDHLPANVLAAREPREILDDLARRGHDGFILCGVCSGAARALLAAGDPRVKGLVLINPEATADTAPADVSAQFYLRRSLRNPRAWRNLLTGRVKYRELLAALARQASRFLSRGRRPPGPRLIELFLKELDPALRRATPALLVLSDRHAALFRLLGDDAAQLQRYPSLRVELHPEADHLFMSSAQAQVALVQQICDWAQQLQLYETDTALASGAG